MSLVQVYTAHDEIEAYFVKNLLEQAGLDAVVMGGTLASAYGGLPMVSDTRPSVWVLPEDLEHAEAVVAEYVDNLTDETDAPPTGEDWTCPHCGETVEAQFTDCWKCQTPRPEAG